MRAHEIGDITFAGSAIDDFDALSTLPEELRSLLEETNGFILHHGGLHVRGAVMSPEWHSLWHATHGPHAIHQLYTVVDPTDIPFAQDCFGDQFLLRGGRVFRLWSETGEIEEISLDLTQFFASVATDAFEFLDFSPDLRLNPGELLHAYPPFCTTKPEGGYSIRAIAANDLILFHADFASGIAGIPDGGQFQLVVTD